ncbi:hypothetical protein JCM10207_003843 [Rhodosporidiobolus poonsookiae]
MAHDALHEAGTVDSPILASSKGAGDEGKEHGDEGMGGQAGSSALERLPDELLDLIFRSVFKRSRVKAELFCISKRLHPFVKSASYETLAPTLKQQPAILQRLSHRKDVSSLVHCFTYIFDRTLSTSALEYECAILGALDTLKSLTVRTNREGTSSTFPSSLHETLRSLRHLTCLTLDNSVKMSFGDATFRLSELPSLRHFHLCGSLGRMSRFLALTPATPLTTFSFNPAVPASLPLRRLKLDNFWFFNSHPDETPSDPAQHEQVQLLQLLAQTSVHCLEIHIVGSPVVPILPLLPSVQVLRLNAYTVLDVHELSTFSGLLALLRALPSLRHLDMDAYFSDRPPVDEDPASDAFLLANPHLPAFLLYLRKSKIVRFVWREWPYTYQYSRTSASDDFQVERFTW